MFGSQADVARAFQLDRAVVHHWVKLGYVPARWAGEVERITEGRIAAAEVVHEASAKNPVRVKSRAPSLYAVQALEKMIVGGLIADVIAVIGSTDVVMGDVDR